MNREQRKKNAEIWNQKMIELFSSEIKSSIHETLIFSNNVDDFKAEAKDLETKVCLVDKDAVKALFEDTVEDEKVALLNFASYKNPGGGFLNGSIAQEENLCHSSFLYNVLIEFQNYYKWNKKHLNHSLYLNRALYSPSIIFVYKNRKYRKANVITCAAPNKHASKQYNISDHENFVTLEKRIEFIFDIALKTENNTLILGAYGCGIFGQNPNEVANLFLKCLNSNKYKSRFEKVILAVPVFNEKDSHNYFSFKEAIEKMR